MRRRQLWPRHPPCTTSAKRERAERSQAWQAQLKRSRARWEQGCRVRSRAARRKLTERATASAVVAAVAAVERGQASPPPQPAEEWVDDAELWVSPRPEEPPAASAGTPEADARADPRQQEVRNTERTTPEPVALLDTDRYEEQVEALAAALRKEARDTERRGSRALRAIQQTLVALQLRGSQREAPAMDFTATTATAAVRVLLSVSRWAGTLCAQLVKLYAASHSLELQKVEEVVQAVRTQGNPTGALERLCVTLRTGSTTAPHPTPASWARSCRELSQSVAAFRESAVVVASIVDAWRLGMSTSGSDESLLEEICGLPVHDLAQDVIDGAAALERAIVRREDLEPPPVVSG